ncbi:hypothetical protein ACYULU_10175 [Breznakiellaceae bacterium SP9]
MLIIDKDTSTPIPVAVYENFGDERRISAHVGADLLNSTTADEVKYQHGDTIHLEFNAEKTHRFDLQTGVRMGS